MVEEHRIGIVRRLHDNIQNLAHGSIWKFYRRVIHTWAANSELSGHFEEDSGFKQEERLGFGVRLLLNKDKSCP